MLTRPIPRTGEPLPVVGLGTWQAFDVGPRDAQRTTLREVVRILADGGGRVIDSSPMYGRAEETVGDLLADLATPDRYWLATKVWTTGRAAGIRQMETSFRRMRTARMDLMQIHNLVDWRTHAATLAAWKAEGRVRHVGVTHYHAGAHAEVEAVVAGGGFDFVQINYSLAEPEAEETVLRAAEAAGTAVLVNRPFGQGAIFHRVRGRALPAWAAEVGCTTWSAFFLKWILAHPAVTCVIPGTGDPAHMLDALAAGAGPLPDAALRRRMLEHVRTL
jgi:aryl-alcohol dehydrogenase-like predicted oxidoreductase